MLEAIGVQFFMGGSHRFGYDVTTSDIDLFILVDDKNINIISELINMGGCIVQTPYLGVECTRLKLGVYDINLFSEHLRSEWIKLCTEHDAIEMYLRTLPGIAKTIRAMKLTGVFSDRKGTGSAIYRILAASAKSAGYD